MRTEAVVCWGVFCASWIEWEGWVFIKCVMTGNESRYTILYYTVRTISHTNSNHIGKIGTTRMYDKLYIWKHNLNNSEWDTFLLLYLKFIHMTRLHSIGKNEKKSSSDQHSYNADLDWETCQYICDICCNTWKFCETHRT
jgi:hypothetical protein